MTFLERQKSLLERCYPGNLPRDVNMQEVMLVELAQRVGEKDTGLGAYLHNMRRASTHPDTGIPSAMVSGRLVFERITDELAAFG